MALTNNRTVVADAAGGGGKSKSPINNVINAVNRAQELYNTYQNVEPVTGQTFGEKRAEYIANANAAKNANNGGGGSTTTYVYSGGSDYNPYADLLAERNALMQKNYQMALDQLRSAYESNVNSLKTQGEDALREAYVNMMMNKRGLNQNLANTGLTGGAAESTMANLFNTYANDRNKIARTLNESLEQAGRTYNTGVANLGMNFNNNYADVLNDYYDQLAAAKASLQGALTPIVSKSTSTTPTQQATISTPTVNRSNIVNSLRGYNSYDDALAALNAMNLSLTKDDWTSILAQLESLYPARIQGSNGVRIR